MTPPADNRVTHFARTNFRNERKVFGIKRAARRYHMYLIGKTGTGKSTLLETMIRQDIAHGEGVALLDPHGDLAERVIECVPEKRQADLIYWNVPDQKAPIGFNPLERMAPEKCALAASGLLEVFKKLWNDSWGPRLEHILRNALLALPDQPEATLADVLRLLSDKAFRRGVALKITNRQVADLWLREFEAYPVRLQTEAIAPIQNKVGAFLSNPILNRILTHPKSSFDLRQVLDQGRILPILVSPG